MSSEKEAKSGLHLTTLVISSAAAVAAAVIVPMFWARGSLLATAITPIIVAVVTEALNRPAKVITQVTPRVTRRSATGAAVRAEQPTGVGARGDGPERVSRWGTDDDPFGLRATEPPGRRFPLKLAVVTGLLAALIAAVTVTASELALFGHSVGNSGRSTSVWGGSPPEEEEATPTATPEATETASPEATATATEAPKEAPTATPTPTVSAVPTPLTTPPAEVTPAPTP